MKRSIAVLAALLALGALPLAAEQEIAPGAQPQGPEAATKGVPGFYDPATRTFKPLAAPAAGTTEFQPSVDFKIRMQFGTSTPLDFPTVGCIFSARYVFPNSGVAATGYLSKTASIQFDAAEMPPPARVLLRFNTSETSPKLAIDVQCTAYDINNIGHTVRIQSVVTLTSPDQSLEKTYTLTVP